MLFFAFFVRSPGVFLNRLSPTKKQQKTAQATLASPSRMRNHKVGACPCHSTLIEKL
ncbi:MAG: hypothetical protein ACEQSF_05700 [Solirubrobacteraceae bacterium]